MGGNYEFRKFIQKNKQSLQLNKEDSFIDIYFIRKGCELIGIKFREPKEKQYGWKLEDFQCKIANTSVHQSGVLLEKWDKYYMKMKNSIKLKTKLGKVGKQEKMEKKEKNQQESDDEAQITQQSLQKKSLKIYKSLCNTLQNSQICKHKAVQDFCKDSEKEFSENCQNLQIFIIKKDKIKSSKSLIYCPQIFYYETESIEGKNVNTLIEQFVAWGQENLSYPRLLNRLLFLEEKKQKDIKIKL